MLPPTSLVVDPPLIVGAVVKVTVYESIPMFARAVCVLLISVNGTLCIINSSTVAPEACATAASIQDFLRLRLSIHAPLSRRRDEPMKCQMRFGNKY